MAIVGALPLDPAPVTRGRVHSSVLLDPHPLWLDAVERVLARVGIRVLAKATDPEAAVALVDERRPDLLVMETEFPEPGIAAAAYIRSIRRRAPGLEVVVLSLSDDADHVDAALAAGAAAFVSKSVHADDLASAFRQTFDHSVYLARGESAAAPAANERARALTAREREILSLAAEGYSNAELARLLSLSEPTVKVHLSNVYRKLGVANRTEASRVAQLQGLVPAVSARGREPRKGD